MYIDIASLMSMERLKKCFIFQTFLTQREQNCRVWVNQTCWGNHRDSNPGPGHDSGTTVGFHIDPGPRLQSPWFPQQVWLTLSLQFCSPWVNYSGKQWPKMSHWRALTAVLMLIREVVVAAAVPPSPAADAAVLWIPSFLLSKCLKDITLF